MKILSVTAQKPNSTGSGTYLTELVNSFARMGCEQAVVCGITHEDLPFIMLPDGVACYPVYFSSKAGQQTPCALELGFPIVGMSDVMPYESTRYCDLTPAMIECFEAAFVSVLTRAIEELRPDLIICHHLFLLTSIVRKHFPSCKVVGISHGTDLRQMVNCAELAHSVKPHIAKLDRIFALHEEQKKQIIEIFDISPGLVEVIGSGYNAILFNMGEKAGGYGKDYATEDCTSDSSSPVRICYAGKLSRAKGVPELFLALDLLADSTGVSERCHSTESWELNIPSCLELTLAGGCQDEEVIKLLSKLPSNCKWLGQIPQPELAKLFKQNDIFVLPSYFEGLPLVLIEAMASGLIPICTDLPGIRPWIEMNVPDHNIIFVPMPEMASIDTPTSRGRDDFTRNLADAIKEAIGLIQAARLSLEDSKLLVPDTSTITWDSVANKLILLAM